MPTEVDLLAGIFEHPADLERWLILSDWLEDQGDPRCELARLHYLLHAEPDHPERQARLARRQDLHDSGLSPVVPTWTNALGVTFALILPGTFLMGSPEDEEGRYGDETLHRVELTQPYLLGVYPVTVGQFRRFVEATGYQTAAESAGAPVTWGAPGFYQTIFHPVTGVNWNDAQAMIAWLNQSAANGRVHSLPTEAQWEYACRAGTQTTFFWGDDRTRIGDYAWYDENAEHRTHPIKTKKPNPWGLWHLAGHVQEWCLDGFAEYDLSVRRNPIGRAVQGTSKVVRGGSWRRVANCCRSAFRDHIDPDRQDASFGFRLACSCLPVA